MRILLTLAVLCAATTISSAQNLHGLATGNYAGIAGLEFNPASIVDSRYKFDLNLIAGQYGFGNNYLGLKPGVFARRLFQKEPYNSSWDAVTRDLLTPLEPAPNRRVRARLYQNFQLPLSMMITTGKRSAIALNLRNRYVGQLDSLNVATADMLYGQLRNPELYGINMNNNNVSTRFMNWQEIGFTYGRVIFNWNKHFLKAAVTAKWVGANAGAVIEASRLDLTFLDSQRMTMRSPGITYARTSRADFKSFSRLDFLGDIAGQTVGFDVGLVYEFRGRIGNFKYTDEDYKSRLRRDKNKYSLRIGVALNDMGVVSFDNRLPLTRNHSANITNWNFGGVKANNLAEWDTAYSRQVNYFPGQSDKFSIQLPTAFIANVDLHLFGGIYVNAAMQRNVNRLFGDNTLGRLRAGEWYAITPRIESKFFGLYLPVIFSQGENTFGATLRLGPVYVGSNNLVELVTNEQVPRADVHAGLRIPIAYGKPTKLSRLLEKETGLQLNEDVEDRFDSINLKGKDLENRIALLERMADSNFRPTVIVNNYITDSSGKMVMTSAVDNQQGKSTTRSTTESNVETMTQAQYDSLNAENKALRKDAAKRLKKEGVSEPKAPKESNSNDGKTTKKAKKKQERYATEQRRYNDAMEEEMKKMRKQQAVGNAALVGAVTAGTIVDANQGKKHPDTVKVVKTDTIYAGGTRVDTVQIRDTVKVPYAVTTTPQVVAPVTGDTKVIADYKIYFANGSAALAPAYKDLIDEIGKAIRNNPEATIRLVGQTDATGSPTANKQLASRRIDAVVQQLKYRGIDITKLEKVVQVSEQQTKLPAEEKRRVDIVIQGN